MAAIQKTTCHVRSISLPSISHPLVVNVEDHLCRLRATEATSSASSVSHSLINLRNLYESVHDMMQLPVTQQTLSQEANGQWTDEILDGSLRLLDVCSTAKNVLLHTKESTRTLKSSLRRRRGAGSDLAAGAESYMVSRNMTKKIAAKCIQNLRNVENTCSPTLLDKDGNLVSVVDMLREIEAISLSTLKSLLCYVSGTQVNSKKNGWSMVSKMMQPKHKSCKTEMSDLESLINKLNKQKYSSEDIELVMDQLETSEMAMQALENGLESIFKCLIKTRVSILNMLNQ